MIRLKKILYPTDFSEYARNALPYVTEMARLFQAKVCLVHVMSLPHYAYYSEALIPAVTAQDEVREWSQQKLDVIAEEIRAQQLEVETVMVEGSAFVEIVAVARERQADLIIMATHGWGTLKHLLIGGTAERVVRKAPCPVLTIKHPEHEFIAP